MRSLLLIGLLGSTAIAAQAPGPDQKVAAIAAEVSPDRMKATVGKLVSFGTRHTLSSQTDPKRGIGAALSWAEAEFKSLKLETVRPCDTVTGKRVPTPTRVCDMIGIQRGTERPNDVVIIQGHIDSRVTDPMNATADAPGANDDGSGTPAPLSMRRCRGRNRGSTAARSSPITPRRRAGTSSPI
jgi:Zn-dependent M28 family amino/carboxypeptidase